MYHAYSESTYCYIDGQFIPYAKATLHVLDLGVLRGYGVFDYVQVYQGRPFALELHLHRLLQAASCIEIPTTATIDTLRQITYAFIEKNQMENGGIRFILTGGITDDSLLLPAKVPSLLVLGHPYAPIPSQYYAEGMRALTTTVLRSMPSVKTTGYVPAILAMKRAKQHGYDDALYLDEQGKILEATTSNVFFYKQGIWMTPDKGQIVEGITRGILLDLLGNSVMFKKLNIDEAVECEEAFLCSSVKDAIPLVQIDGRSIGNGKPGIQTSHIRKQYRNMIRLGKL